MDPAPARWLLALLPLQLGSYATRREIPLPATPVGLLAADVDGDGRVDLVATLREPGLLALWGARGQGIADAPCTIGVGDWPLAPALFRRADGARIAVASRAARTLRSFRLGSAGEGLVPAELALDLPDAPRAIASAGEGIALAFDGGTLWRIGSDGRPSVQALAGKLPRCLRLSSSGALAAGCQDTQELELLAPGGGALRLALSGIPRDILELGPASGEWAVACGGGRIARVAAGGSGAAPRVVAELPCAAIPIALGLRPDAAGRGAELFCIAQRGNLLQRWQRKEDGAFALVASDYAGQSPVALALGDLDRDGEADAVVANEGARALSWFAGRPGGGFAGPRNVGVGRFPDELAGAELDGQPGREVVALNAKDGTLSIVGASPSGPRERLRAPVGSNPRALCCADFDGDGRDEIACALQDGARTRLALLSLSAAGRLEDRLAGAAIELGPDVVALLPGPPAGKRTLVSADATSGELVAWEVSRGDGTGLRVVAGARCLLGSSPGALAWRAPGRLVAACSGPGPRRGLAFVALGPSGFEVELWLPSERSPRDLCATSAGLFVLETEPANPFQGCLRCALWSAGAALVGPWVEATCGLTPRRLLALEGGEILVACQDSHVVDLWRCAPDPRGGALRLERAWDLGAGAGCIALAAVDFEGQGRTSIVVANSAGDDLSVLEREAASGR